MFSELKAGVGPDATLDDDFIKLVATRETEVEGSYGEVRRARRTAREHADGSVGQTTGTFFTQACSMLVRALELPLTPQADIADPADRS